MPAPAIVDHSGDIEDFRFDRRLYCSGIADELSYLLRDWVLGAQVNVLFDRPIKHCPQIGDGCAPPAWRYAHQEIRLVHGARYRD